MKHVCNLIIAEAICEPCIRAGITTDDKDSLKKAEGCKCVVSSDPDQRARAQHYRSRRLRYDNFEDFDTDGVELFGLPLVQGPT